MTDRPVKVLLDASAVVAFTRGSIDVGKVIAEVDDERGTVSLPILCLVEATRAVADQDRLTLLIDHRATVLLTDDATSWKALAAMYDIVGRLDAASVALAATDRQVNVLTAQPGLYGGLADGGPVIPI